MRSLTNKESQLIEKNHNLIYSFAKRKNLVLDDYYDILAIGLCKAAIYHDEKKGAFSTIAYNCMQSELDDYFKSLQRKYVVPEECVISFDAVRFDDNSANNDSFLSSLIVEFNATEDLIIGELVCESFKNILNDVEKQVLELLLQDYTHREIAEYVGCSHQSITYYIKKIKIKYANFLKDNS